MIALYQCQVCGKTEFYKKYPFNLCQQCYAYFRNGGKVYKLPPIGRIVFDKQGKLICHICGKSYKKLGSHAIQAHGLTASEYRKEFGLCANCRLTSDDYSQKMRDYAYKYDMDLQLQRTGKATRLAPGDKLRKGKDVALQEVLDKHDRMTAYYERNRSENNGK